MRVLSVSQINFFIKSLIEGDGRMRDIYARGEISNFTDHYRSGHLYFSLKDEKSVLKAVMFSSAARRLRFCPKEGMRVIVRGRVAVYEPGGQYQFYVEEMQPDGVGALSLAFEQLKEKLAAEGLFAEEHKRPIPPFPARIGVITSPTGAAVQDIRNILSRRWPAAEIVFCPVLVQGEDAAAQLTAAVKLMNAQKAADVIIIGRGGGSIEELWAFNDEGVARAVAASKIPVISAVGHETDFTICDFAADLRAPTPSAAAELAVPDRTQLLARVEQMQGIARRGMRSTIDAASHRLTVVRSRRCLSTPLFYVEEQGMRLDYLTRAFVHAAQNSLSESGRRLAAIGGKLDALSPLKVLSRGYSIPYTGEKVVKSTKDVAAGDPLTLRVSDGMVACTVDRVEADDKTKKK